MDKQLVDMAVINLALNLHQATPLASTLSHIAELLTFRAEHERCRNLIFTLKDQLANVKVELFQQTSHYFSRKLEADKLESQALLRVRQLGGGNDMDMGVSMSVGEMGSQRKEYPLYESLEQFMQKQFEIKVRQRGKDKTGKENGQTGLGMVKSVNQYFLPVAQTVRAEGARAGSESIDVL